MTRESNVAWPYPTGTIVIYTEVRGDPKSAWLTTTTSDAWKLGDGRWVVMIYGVSGGVAVDHLVAVPRRALDEAHERTQQWLDKFQGLAAAKEIELLKWRSWALKHDVDKAMSDDEWRAQLDKRLLP